MSSEIASWIEGNPPVAAQIEPRGPALLELLTSELAHHGIHALSIEKCVDSLFSELPSHDAKNLLRHLLEDEQQCSAFSIMEGPGTASDAKIRVSQDHRMSSANRLDSRDESEKTQIQQADSKPAKRKWIARPWAIVEFTLAMIGLCAAVSTLWPYVAPLFAGAMYPEIVLMTSRWEDNAGYPVKASWDWLQEKEKQGMVAKTTKISDDEYLYQLKDGPSNDRLNFRVLLFREKNNRTIDWENIKRRLAVANPVCLILDSNSSHAHEFLDEFQKLASKVPVVFPGQTDSGLRGSGNENRFFLSPDDQKQADRILELLNQINPSSANTTENGRVAVIWDYDNPFHTQGLAEVLERRAARDLPEQLKMAVFMGFGEMQMENSNVFFGVEALNLLSDAEISNVVFAGSSAKTAKRFLGYLDSKSLSQPLNIVFTDGIADTSGLNRFLTKF